MKKHALRKAEFSENGKEYVYEKMLSAKVESGASSESCGLP
jgi:hypothetical protein